jgi:hypothetical protein
MALTFVCFQRIKKYKNYITSAVEKINGHINKNSELVCCHRFRWKLSLNLKEVHAAP